MYIVDILIECLPQAALYALMAVGLVVIYRTTRVLNFAQGYLGLICGYLFYAVANALPGTPFAVPLIIAVIIAAFLGLALYRVFLARISTAYGDFVPVVYTIAIAWIIEAVVGIIWNGQSHSLSSPLSRRGHHLGLGILLSPLEIGITLLAVVMIVALTVWMHRSRLGAVMRAVSDNPTLVLCYGRSVRRASGIAWAIGTVAAMLVGVAYGVNSSVDFSIVDLGFAAFPAILIGGLDSIPGVLVGSVVIAFAETLVGSQLGGQYSEPISMALALAVLLARPQGLFGTKSLVRV
jgi:branched-chain amino acid transport system permease protein